MTWLAGCGGPGSPEGNNRDAAPPIGAGAGAGGARARFGSSIAPQQRLARTAYCSIWQHIILLARVFISISRGIFTAKKIGAQPEGNAGSGCGGGGGTRGLPRGDHGVASGGGRCDVGGCPRRRPAAADAKVGFGDLGFREAPSPASIRRGSEGRRGNDHMTATATPNA